MATTWRNDEWEPSDQECRVMAEAVLDMWYSTRATSQFTQDGNVVEGYTAVVLEDGIWKGLCSSVPFAYCGPVEGEGS
jgi:hypothetical protein